MKTRAGKGLGWEWKTRQGSSVLTERTGEVLQTSGDLIDQHQSQTGSTSMTKV